MDKDALAAVFAQPDDNGPPPMAWTEHSARVMDGLADVLPGDGKERAVQSYLAQHPVLIPGATLHLS